MRNPETWQPTKYVIRGNQLCGSANRRHLGVASRLIAQIVADAYSKYIPAYCRGDLADIGCGFAPMYEFYRQHVSSVTTIDWAESLHANEHLDIITDLNTAPIPGVADQSYDSIILSDVLEHIYHTQTLLGELHRILKPGGVLLMNVPFFYWIHESPHDYYRYTEFALKRHVEDAGFEVIEFERLGGQVACMIDIFSKWLYKHGGRGILSKTRNKLYRFITALTQNTVCALRNIKPFRSLLLKNNEQFPLAYFLVARKKGE